VRWRSIVFFLFSFQRRKRKRSIFFRHCCAERSSVLLVSFTRNIFPANLPGILRNSYVCTFFLAHRDMYKIWNFLFAVNIKEQCKNASFIYIHLYTFFFHRHHFCSVFDRCKLYYLFILKNCYHELHHYYNIN